MPKLPWANQPLLCFQLGNKDLVWSMNIKGNLYHQTALQTEMKDWLYGGVQAGRRGQRGGGLPGVSWGPPAPPLLPPAQPSSWPVMML